MTAYRHPFAVAPMMDRTDRHCRFFHRQLTRRALLYTEMITAEAIIHGDRQRLLGFSGEEHPVALQLGGSDPAKLVEAVRIAEAFGYDEVNLNVGCPSDRVQSGTFGACLMREPALVADCVAAMMGATRLPVTVKCRLGVDEQDIEAALDELADKVIAAGAAALWVHARKAWLKGLSPKENREVPPLDYGRVHRLKARLPGVFVGINGGIRDLDVAEGELAHVDGVMLGRAACDDPWLLASVDRRFHGAAADTDVFAAAEAMIAYAERELARGERLGLLVRPMLGLFNGRPGARAWRRHLGEGATRPGAGADVIRAALTLVARPEAEAA
jgi:tRNA-dihydrouridine synthase A